MPRKFLFSLPTVYHRKSHIAGFPSLFSTLIVLASSVWMAHVPQYDLPQDVITVLRLLFLAMTMLSPILVFPATPFEDRFLLFGIEQWQTRFALLGVIISYFMLSPRSMWQDGDSSCPAEALLLPAFYSAFIIYEQCTFVQSGGSDYSLYAF
jgi:hypothetical protein